MEITSRLGALYLSGALYASNYLSNYYGNLQIILNQTILDAIDGEFFLRSN